MPVKTSVLRAFVRGRMPKRHKSFIQQSSNIPKMGRLEPSGKRAELTDFATRVLLKVAAAL